MQSPPVPGVPRWHATVLKLAGLYNLAWGAWVVLFPLSSLRICGYDQPATYPEHWQCIGMIVGVYGIGYWIAAGDPVRHWPIVLVGLLGKIFGPLGFLWAFLSGRLPLSAGRMVLVNDLIWWVPFTLILLDALRRQQTQKSAAALKLSFEGALHSVQSQSGQTIAELSAQRPLLLVFLRHDGCTFCRETLARIASNRNEIELSAGIAFVHMADNSEDALFRRYGLEALPRFSDPDQQLYEAFEVRNGRLSQLFAPSTFWHGFQSAILQGHGFGPVRQNVYRLPGAFLVHRGRIVAAHRQQTAGEQVDYRQLSCSLPGG